MIRTSMQLKSLVRNKSGSDSNKALMLIRNHFMNRFLERLSLSPYRDQFILKGGLLITSMVGDKKRSTMDADVTIKGFDLTKEEAERVVNEIIGIDLDDGVVFEIQSVDNIMDEADYPGIRIMLRTTLDKMRTPMKLDISTGDIITPREIEYDYPLLFEDRSIPILAYNLETCLAEKLETIISRSTGNTRMRDFYDIHILTDAENSTIDYSVLRDALTNTSAKRNTSSEISEGDSILKTILDDAGMLQLWTDYRNKFDYASAFSWEDVMQSVSALYKKATE